MTFSIDIPCTRNITPDRCHHSCLRLSPAFFSVTVPIFVFLAATVIASFPVLVSGSFPVLTKSPTSSVSVSFPVVPSPSLCPSLQPSSGH